MSQRTVSIKQDQNLMTLGGHIIKVETETHKIHMSTPNFHSKLVYAYNKLPISEVPSNYILLAYDSVIELNSEARSMTLLGG